VKVKIHVVWRQGFTLDVSFTPGDWIDLGFFPCSIYQCRMLLALMRYLCWGHNITLEVENEDKLLEDLRGAP